MVCMSCSAEIANETTICPSCGNLQATPAKMSFTQLYFSFKGRVSRSTYWFAYKLPFSAVYLAAIAIDAVTGNPYEGSGIGPCTSVVGLIAAFPELAMMAKRLHDRNRSAWILALWALLLAIPIVNILALFWAFIELGCLKGTEGSNKYGPDPVS